MRICVQGLWHLGCVTAACLAAAGFATVGLDDDTTVVADLVQGEPPLFEPGLAELVKRGLASGSLTFTTDSAAVREADLIWITHDTPVDDDDRADVAQVEERVAALFPHLRDGAVVLVSSQLPVGSVRQLARRFAMDGKGRRVAFCVSPENLRLGKAIEVFTHPERIIVGISDPWAKPILESVLSRFSSELQWMSVESAEMVKHSLNAWLATSVTFINEIATICERVGADAGEVEAGLRSEPRVGRRAYIRPGGAFAGGTLARDVNFLMQLAEQNGLILPLVGGILSSNTNHRQWALHRLVLHYGELAGRPITLLGLTYKPGTDTLRRSAAIELAGALVNHGAKVRLYDPVVARIPGSLGAEVQLCGSVEMALDGSDAAVIGTEWPEFAELKPALFVESMRTPLILDQNRFIAASLSGDDRLTYLTIGKPT